MSLFKTIKRGPITQEHLNAYAEASGDFNPIHLERSVAEAVGFDNTIVHGMLSMAIMGDWISIEFPEDKYQVINFKAKFKKVTMCGDTLTCQGEIKSQKGGDIVVSVCIKNQLEEVTTEGTANLRQI
jgi:acyl dehydratase